LLIKKGKEIDQTHTSIMWGMMRLSKGFFQCTGIMLKRSQLKDKWDKLKNDLSVWRKLMRKQTGTGWSWSTGSIYMDADWWKKIKSVST
jgi:hypothetical protein